jgi:hypothetical protein
MATNTSTKPHFVTFACAKDVHYAKALLGSVRFFYPDHPVHVVLDDDVVDHHSGQMSKLPHVHVHRRSDLARLHQLDLRGLLAKLSVFFIPGVEHALVADADSVLTGPVLEHIDCSCVLNSLNSMTLDLADPSQRAMFARWAFDIDAIQARESRLVPQICPFVQGSHFYVNVEAFPKDVLLRMLPDMSQEHSDTHVLRAGDQGLWNYLAHFGQLHGITAIQSPVTIQVGVSPHDSRYDDVTFLERPDPKDYYFLHYVGFSRRFLRQRHEYSTALIWATRQYYRRLGSHRFLIDELRRTLALVSRATLGKSRTR